MTTSETILWSEIIIGLIYTRHVSYMDSWNYLYIKKQNCDNILGYNIGKVYKQKTEDQKRNKARFWTLISVTTA